MQNLQVPVWLGVVITIGVALIGAVAPTIANLVNQRRERQRDELKAQRDRERDELNARRDQERDKLKAQRDRERDELSARRDQERDELKVRQERELAVLRLDAERTAQWRETKLSTYGALLASLEEISYTYGRMVREASVNERTKIYSQYEKASEDLRQSFQQARLFGSGELTDMLYGDMSPMIGQPRERWIEHSPECPVDQCDFQHKHHAMFFLTNCVREVARKELGITDESGPVQSG